MNDITQILLSVAKQKHLILTFSFFSVSLGSSIRLLFACFNLHDRETAKMFDGYSVPDCAVVHKPFLNQFHQYEDNYRLLNL